MNRQQLKSRKKWTVTAIAAVIILVAWGCTKTVSENTDAESIAREDNATGPHTENVKLQYKDSILYYRSAPKNYTVKPIRKPKVPGYFVPSPEGLVINASNGTIEVNNSEAGLHYKVYYMSMTNEPIDSVTIRIAGIDYEDGIFEIANTSEHDTASPVYEGADSTFPCARGNGQCSFNETDLDGDGDSDIDGVNGNKLQVNKKNGVIDLEESFNNGVFGSLTPPNGIFKDFTIHYRLDDPSQKALNKITIRLYHFKSRDQIPAWLIDELKRRKESYDAVDAPATQGNFIQSNLYLLAPKRPPLIIIVSGLTTTLR
ncbi:MAG: hypothetical protein JNK79_13020 [Chitinophagaceae bacterium]|nr:hypothetical protein [Chitinophagaceae bacterium]